MSSTQSGRKRSLQCWVTFGPFSKLCDVGQLRATIEHLKHADQQGLHASTDTFFRLLQRCMNEKDVAAGREVNCLIARSVLKADTFLGTHLIRMFTQFESLSEANQVFSNLPHPNVFTWNAIILAHVKLGQNEQAIDLYYKMQISNVQPNGHIFVAVLKACTSVAALKQGKQVHADIINFGFESDTFVGGSLIHMYIKCGSCLEDAYVVLNKLRKPNVVTCNALIAAYIHHGKSQEPFQVFRKMQREGTEPDTITFLYILKACSTTAALELGRQIHLHIVESSMQCEISLCNTLMDMYTKSGCLEDARTVFNTLSVPDIATWSVLISGYAQHGHYEDAFQTFAKMQQDGIEPDPVMFVSILKVCSGTKNLEQGKQIHALVIVSGFELDMFVGSSLIGMYSKCGSLMDAHMVFDRLPKQNLVTWSALITGYAQHGLGDEALLLFEKMQQNEMEPDPVILACVLRACSCTGTLEQGRRFHMYLVTSGFEADVYIGSTLIDMYVKCSNLEDACTVFGTLQNRNVVTWNALIAGYTQCGNSFHVLQLFEQMQLEGMKPDQGTFVSILKVCSSIGDLSQCRQIHFHIIESGLESDMNLGCSLIDMYAKCGSVEDAHTVMGRLPKVDVVTWSALISGYAMNGHEQGAFQLFNQMDQEEMTPNLVTFVSILKVCSSTGSLAQGRHIHEDIVKSAIEVDTFVGSTLIDMYANCGSLEDACKVFETLVKQDGVTWSTLIEGYAQNSDYISAFQCFSGMQRAGFKPDATTFLCLLSACSHLGLVNEGCLHFQSMREDYGIAPTLEHYNSMVDLFGHAGYLNEAEDLLETIPFQHNLVGWTSLLSSCRTHANMDLGKRCFDHLITLNCENATGFVLMLNIYGHAGMWENVEEMEELRIHANAWKQPAKASIDIDFQVCEFIVGDKIHSKSDDINAKLRRLEMQLREEGYKPRCDLVTLTQFTYVI